MMIEDEGVYGVDERYVKTIYLLNGAPRVGKDTLARYLEQRYNGKLLKFAAPIKRAVTAIYHGDNKAEFDYYDSPEMKDTPQDVYFGKTCREVQIGVSESFLKPFHNDQGVFGKILAKEIERQVDKLETGPFFVSDSGFRREAEVLVDKYGADKVVLIRIHREGHTFRAVGDSRDYINLKDLGVREFDLDNPEDNHLAFFGAAESIIQTIK